MSEFGTSPEVAPEISREQVIAAYQEYIKHGFTNPDKLDLDIPAHQLFYQWVEQGDAKAEGDPVETERFNFLKTMFYVDAGFTDPVYLAEIWDLLQEDARFVAEMPNDERTAELSRDIADAIVRIEKMLPPEMLPSEEKGN